MPNNPYQPFRYPNANRRLIRVALVWLTAMLTAWAATAQPLDIKREEFLPAQGKGAVVVVVSGASGPAYFRDTASRLAALGYLAVLVDGGSIYKRYPPAGFDGAGILQRVIAEAAAAPQAIAGKAAVLGFSIGGAAVLVHGAPMKDHVSAVVAYYPAITPLGPDMSTLAVTFRVPVLLIAGEQDRYTDCCLIQSMQSLAAAPKTAPFDLVTYPAAGHGFNLEETQFAYLPADSADAWAKVTAFLQRLHPPGGVQ